MKKIVLCGIQKQGVEIIEFLLKNNIRVTHIVTITYDTSKINNSETTWVSYEDVSKKYDIPIYYANSYGLRHESDIKFFAENLFDILLLGGWQRLIPDTILSSIKFSIGQHGSSERLPKFRGRSPLNWSIITGKKRIIWNLFLIDKEIDNGDIVDSHQFEINEYDDCKTLYYKVETVVKYMLVRSIPKLLDGTIVLQKQFGTPSYYEKRTAEDGKINWQQSVFDIYNLIRGVTRPYPGAFTLYNNSKIMIWKAQVWDTIIDFYYLNDFGEIVEVFDNDNFVIKCYDGLLLVTDHDDIDIFIGKKYFI